MNRLADLLHETPDPQDAWMLDPMALVAAGEHRVVRRRRRVRAGVAGAAAVVLAITVAGQRVIGDDGPDVVEPAPAPGEYHDVWLDRSEMEHRCSRVLGERNGTDVRYVAGRAPDGTAVPGSQVDHYVETREGWAVRLVPEGEVWPASAPLDPEPATGPRITPAANRARLGTTADVCVIPQEPAMPLAEALQAVPAPTDEEAIVRACTRASGYDLTGWDVVGAVRHAAASSPASQEALDAVLLSTNGQAAWCWLSQDLPGGIGMIPRRYRGPTGEPLLLPEDIDPATRFAVVAPTVDPALGVGVIPGLPDDWQVRVVADGSPLATVTTDLGGFAYALEGAVSAQVWTAEVRDDAGALVWSGRLDLGSDPDATSDEPD